MEDQVLTLSDLLGACLIALGVNDVGGKTWGLLIYFPCESLVVASVAAGACGKR